MSTNNNKTKTRQNVKGFDAPYTRKKNPHAQAELDERLNKGRTSPDFLALYLRKIYAERGIGWNQLNHYISLHLRDVVARDPTRSSKDLGTARGNIMKELERGTMTWKNFVGKLRLIRIRKIVFGMSLTDDTGDTTYHEAEYLDATVPMAMGPYDDEEHHARIEIDIPEDTPICDGDEFEEDTLGFKL